MLAPWWRELQKLSLPSEIFVSQCKNMSVLRWLPCSLMQKVTVRRSLSMEPILNSLICAGNVQDRELEQIHSRYMNCLRTFIEYNYPQEPNRVQELLVKLPEVRSESGVNPPTSTNVQLLFSRFKKPPDYSWSPRCSTSPSCWTPPSAPAGRRTRPGLSRETSRHSKIIQFSHFSEFAIIVTILPIYSNSYSSPV